jgi:uncharacterized glyoxalase superfamily protein PhnB
MTIATQKITPCLWFDSEAEDAAEFYVSVFRNSRIASVNRYGKEGHDVHGKPAGSVMSVEFEIEGQKFVGLNGGPQFKFSEAISFQIHCKTHGRWQGGCLRLAQGQVRPVVAGGADRALRDAVGQGPRQDGACDQGLHADEEVRHRQAAPRLRRARMTAATRFGQMVARCRR